MSEMFLRVSAETPWEWAKARRTYFTTPLRDGVVACAIGITTALVSWALAVEHWQQGVLVGVLATVMAGFGLPFLEALTWRLRRNSVLRDEAAAVAARRLAQLEEEEVRRQSANSSNADKKDREPLTIKDLFERDFPHTFKDAANFLLRSQGDAAGVLVRGCRYSDFFGRAKYVGFLLPPATPESVVRMTEALIAAVSLVLAWKDVAAWYGDSTGQRTSAPELVFTSRVFVYHGTILSMEQTVELRRLYEAKGFSLHLRGLDYLSFK